MATAAAPGFSPLLGSTLDRLFGWRSEFVFVAVAALCTAAAFAAVVGETRRGAASSLNPLKIAGS
jgi:DHA1 family bicyclomycin/chloramphenicol resistance-like MFS transporter